MVLAQTWSRGLSGNNSTQPQLDADRDAVVVVVRMLRGLLWANFHAKRLECVQLAGAVVIPGCFESGSKLHPLQTLRAARLPLCHVHLCPSVVLFDLAPFHVVGNLTALDPSRIAGFSLVASVQAGEFKTSTSPPAATLRYHLTASAASLSCTSTFIRHSAECMRAAQKRCLISLSVSISISAPLVIVASRRIVATRRSAEARVPIDFNIANVPIYETDEVLGIVNPVLRGRQFLGLVPGPRNDRREFLQENRFDRVFYRGLFPPKNARKGSLV